MIPFVIYSVILAGLLVYVQTGHNIAGMGMIVFGLFAAFVFDHYFGRAAEVRHRKEEMKE